MRDQFPVDRIISASSSFHKKHPTRRLHLFMSKVYCPSLLDSVDTGGATSFDFKVSEQVFLSKRFEQLFLIIIDSFAEQLPTSCKAGEYLSKNIQ